MLEASASRDRTRREQCHLPEEALGQKGLTGIIGQASNQSPIMENGMLTEMGKQHFAPDGVLFRGRRPNRGVQ